MSESEAMAAGQGMWWDDSRSRLNLLVSKRPVTSPVVVEADIH
jgi:hypothetical protein